MNKLKLRLRIKRKKPNFLRQGAKNLKTLGKKWRMPRGRHSKLKMHKKSKGFLPNSGYGSPAEVRGFHPSGFKEVLVHNPGDLTGIDPAKQACRIAATVGKKKKLDIMKKSEELKIKVLNPFRFEIKKIEAEKK